ncbi:MAG: nucleotidyltransferase family protein [Planctomycetales bacterium]
MTVAENRRSPKDCDVRRIFAVVPAAGHSRRMGVPKLLLPLGGKTVLARLLESLDRPGIAGRFVVVRPDDEPLASEAEKCGATVVRPEIAPPDMRASVEAALEHIEKQHAPAPEEGWLLAPADHPLLDGAVVDALIAHWQQESCGILVPTGAGRRGHPALFRWRLARAVRALPADAGANRLLEEFAEEVRELAVERESVLTDLDTPADYRALGGAPCEGEFEE